MDNKTYCLKCGAELRENEEICHKCGFRIPDAKPNKLLMFVRTNKLLSAVLVTILVLTVICTNYLFNNVIGYKGTIKRYSEALAAGDYETAYSFVMPLGYGEILTDEDYLRYFIQATENFKGYEVQGIYYYRKERILDDKNGFAQDGFKYTYNTTIGNYDGYYIEDKIPEHLLDEFRLYEIYYKEKDGTGERYNFILIKKIKWFPIGKYKIYQKLWH